MSDKELLELAAKAAGVKGHFAERTPEDGYPGYTCGIQVGQLVLWNPLTNDGDALRLAADLKVRVVTTEECSADGSNRRGLATANEVTEPYTGNSIAKYAATRRAIVRAAAEIGKAMP